MHSNTMNAAVLAAEDVGGQGKAIELMKVIYDQRELFTDDATLDKTTRDVWGVVAGLAESVGLDKASFLGRFEYLEDGGSPVMKRLKHYIKAGRKQGIHVSPTVFMNGVEDGSVGSSWSAEEWQDRMKQLLEKEDSPFEASVAAAAGGGGGD